MQSLRIACILPLKFQYDIGMMPFRRPIYVVVGEPINFGKISNPNYEEIGKCHSSFFNWKSSRPFLTKWFEPVNFNNCQSVVESKTRDQKGLSFLRLSMKRRALE